MVLVTTPVSSCGGLSGLGTSCSGDFSPEMTFHQECAHLCFCASLLPGCRLPAVTVEPGGCWKLGRGPLPTQRGAPDAPGPASPGLTSAFHSIFMYVPKLKHFNNYSQEAAQIVQREPMSPPASFPQGTTVWVYVPPPQHCEPASVVTPAVPDPVPHLWRCVVSGVLKCGMAEFGGFLPSLRTPDPTQAMSAGPSFACRQVLHV